MLTVKEVTQQLIDAGISVNEKTVTRWLREGKLKADRSAHIKIIYSVNQDDLTAFISKLKTEKSSEDQQTQFKKTRLENERLKEEVDRLRSAISIEQAKVRSLKKMLKAEFALTDYKPASIHSFIGLDAATDKQELKKELKKILKALHPDRGGDERLFKVMYEHYNKLKL